MKGKFSLLYFGFTECPDICPDEMNKMAECIDLVEKVGLVRRGGGREQGGGGLGGAGVSGVGRLGSWGPEGFGARGRGGLHLTAAASLEPPCPCNHSPFSRST